MYEYKIYLMLHDKHIRAREDIVAPDDASALEAAQKFKSEGGIEVWQSARLVARIANGGEAEA